MDKENHNKNEWKKSVRDDAITNFSSRSTLDKALASSNKLEYSEFRKNNLGQHKEDILYTYTKKEIQFSNVSNDIINHIRKKQPKKVIIHNDVPSSLKMKLMKEASNAGIAFTIVDDPKLEGDVAVVLIQ